MVDVAGEEERSIGRKAAGGFVWALIGFIVMQIGSFATYSIASKILGTEGIGVVGVALLIVFWIDILLSVGMGASLIFDQEKGQTERVAIAFTVNVTVGSVLAALIFFGAPFINDVVKAGDANIFRVVALLIVVKSLGQVPDAMLKRDLDFRRRARADFTRSGLRFVVSIALLKAGLGPVAMVMGVVVAEIAATTLTWFLVRFKPVLRFDRLIAAEMLRFGAAMFGAQLVGMLWLQGDYLVLISRYGANSPELGNYYTAFRLPELVLGSVYNMFSSVAFPAYSAARESGDDKLRDASLKSLKVLCLFGFPAGIGMSLIARDFITWFFGADFADAIAVLELLGVAGAFVAVGFASGDLFAAVGKPRLGLYFGLVFVPILMGGFIAVVDRGIVAIAIVHVAVIIPYSAFRIEVANRLLGTTWKQSLAALRPAAAASVGILALALPVRLSLDAGFVSLLAIMFAGLLGAIAGLAVGDRAMLDEVRAGADKAIAKIR